MTYKHLPNRCVQNYGTVMMSFKYTIGVDLIICPIGIFKGIFNVKKNIV